MNDSASDCATLLTPPGAGAIAVIRLAGPNAAHHLASVFHPLVKGAGNVDALFAGGRVRYGHVVVEGEEIDDVLVSRVNADALPAYDICTHGGIRVIERLLSALERLGTSVESYSDRPRLEAAESSLVWPARTLIEQEIVAALWLARTERAVRFLGRQRTHLPERLTDIAALCATDPERAQSVLQGMLDATSAARLLLEGLSLAIVGPPNSGKSTLFNALAGRSAAIVSDLPGTTRDWVTRLVEIDGFPVTLIDTAGHRADSDRLETSATELGAEVAARADIRLFVVDGSIPPQSTPLAALQAFTSADTTIFVANKADVGCLWDEKMAARALPGPRHFGGFSRISAHTGQGLEALVRQILQVMGLAHPPINGPCLFSARQACVATDILSRYAKCFSDANSPIKQQLLGA